MPELVSTLSAMRDVEHRKNKFMAAIQGIDLDEDSTKERGQKEWENLKARVFSKGQASNSDDILSLQGANAAKVGFGIGAGLEYTDAKNLENPSW